MSEPIDDRLANAGTLPAWLRAQAAQHGSALALRRKQRGLWRSQSWRELEAAVLALASALQTRGFLAGDRLLLDIGPVPAAFLITLAASWLGGTVEVSDRASTAAPFDDGVGGRGARFAFVTDDAARARFVAARTLDRPLALGILLDADAGQLASETGWVSFDDLTPSASFTAAGAPALADIATSTTTALIRWTQRASSAAGSDEATPAPSAYTHRELLENARELTRQGCIGLGESALAESALGLGQQLEHVLPSWLLSGFCLNFAEEAGTEDVDRRELGPSVVFGASSGYAALAARVRSNLPSRDRAPGRWLHASLAGRGGLGVISRRLLTGRLREVLGLGRVRRAVALGPAAATAADFEGLFGLSLFEWPPAPAGTLTETRVAAAVDGDAAFSHLSRGLDGAELGAAARSELA